MVATSTLPNPAQETKEVPSKPKSRWHRKWMLALLVLPVVGASWYAAKGDLRKDNRETLPAISATPERNSAAILVTEEPVTFRKVQRAVEALGTLYGYEEISISAKIEGRVRRIDHDVSDIVKPGDVLIEIDPTEYQLSLEQAERGLQVEQAKLGLSGPPTKNFDLEKVPPVMQAQARLENANARLERVRQLVASRAATPEEIDTATSDYRTAQAEHANQLLLAKSGLATIQLKQSALAIAQQQLKETQIRVPVPTQPVPGAGDSLTYVVTHRMVSEGTFVKIGTEVCKLVIRQTLKCRVAVPDRFSNEIRIGQNADVSLAAFPEPVRGTVTRISPVVDAATRTFEVEIQLPNPTGNLKPGSFAKAQILIHESSEATTVPLSAVNQFAGITKLFLDDQGKAKEVQVTLGMQTTQWVEIIKPALPRNAKVVTSGQSMLVNDSVIAVRTLDEKTAPKEPAKKTDMPKSKDGENR